MAGRSEVRSNPGLCRVSRAEPRPSPVTLQGVTESGAGHLPSETVRHCTRTVDLPLTSGRLGAVVV